MSLTPMLLEAVSSYLTMEEFVLKFKNSRTVSIFENNWEALRRLTESASLTISVDYGLDACMQYSLNMFAHTIAFR